MFHAAQVEPVPHFSFEKQKQKQKFR